MKNSWKHEGDIVSNNDLLHYIARLTAIVYQHLDGEEKMARKNMEALEPEMTEALRRLIIAEKKFIKFAKSE